MENESGVKTTAASAMPAEPPPPDDRPSSPLADNSSKQLTCPVLTPNKRKLRAEVNKLRVRNTRLRRKLDGAEELTRELPELSLSEAIRQVSGILDGPSCNFFVDVLKNALKCQQHKRRRRWSCEMKILCMCMYFHSTTAYKHLRKIFLLPSISLLMRPLHGIDRDAGFSTEVEETLKRKVSAFTELERQCVLCFDEISLRSGLSYDQSRDQVRGFSNQGTRGFSKYPANHALVLMIRGSFGNWKQPFAFFFSRNAMNAANLEDILKECLTRLESIGFRVRVIVSDMGQSNQSLFLKRLNVTPESPYFCRDENKYFVMFDTPHLLKCLRNNLKKYDFEVDGNIVYWSYIAKMYEIDTKKARSLRLAPKLTPKHFIVSAFQKMKVKKAAQVLSHSVSSAILFYICIGLLPQEASHTAFFVDKVDKLFDCLNSRSPSNSKVYLRSMTKESPHCEFLEKMGDLFANLKVLSNNTQIPSILGWRISISCVISLWNELQTQLIGGADIKFLNTRFIQQDCLENFFSVIRSKGGFNENPTSDQSRNAYKHCIVNAMVSFRNNANCQPDYVQYLLSLGNFDVKKKNSTVGPICDETELTTSSVLSNPERNAAFYVAGYLVRGHLTKHDCESCRVALLSNKEYFDGEPEIFTVMKSYSEVTGDIGGLMAPSDGLFNRIVECEKVFGDNFCNIIHMEKILSRLVNTVKNSDNILLWFEGEDACRNRLWDLAGRYFKLRIFRAIKEYNQELRKVKQSIKPNRKLAKIAHN